MRKIFTLIAMATFAVCAQAQGTYAVAEGDVFTAGQQITSVTGITMTLGEDFATAKSNSDIAGYTAYAGGVGNPVDAAGKGWKAADGNLPVTGAFVTFVATADGTVNAAVRVNAAKFLYVIDKDAPTAPVFTYENTTGATANAVQTFSVAADKTYYVFVQGSKMSFYGFEYVLGKNAITNQPTVADVVKTEYFTPAGAQVTAPVKGINIVVKTMKDGTKTTTKQIVK